MAKKARLTLPDVIKTISNRTGLPMNMVKSLIEVYSDVVKEAILAEVEIPFGDICVFTWNIAKPKKKSTRWDYKMRKTIEIENVPGYHRLVSKTKPGWKRTLKEATAFYDDENLDDEEEENNELQGDDVDE